MSKDKRKRIQMSEHNRKMAVEENTSKILRERLECARLEIQAREEQIDRLTQAAKSHDTFIEVLQEHSKALEEDVIKLKIKLGSRQIDLNESERTIKAFVKLTLK